MVYIPQQLQNDSHLIQYPNNPVILLPKMTNTMTNSSLNNIMKAVNTDNIPTESYILMPISVVANNPSSSFHIPRPIANIHKSNSLSLSTINLNPIQNSISVSPFINKSNIRKSNNRYQIQQKKNVEKERPFRSTIGVTRGINIFQDNNLLPILPSASLCTANIKPVEVKRLQNISLKTTQQAKLGIDIEENHISHSNKNHCKQSPSENNSVIYDVPNFNVPPLLPPHSSTKISQNPTILNSTPIHSTSFQSSYSTSNNINNGYYSNLTPIIATKYFIPPPPPIDHSIAIKESKRQFKEILRNDRKLKKYQKKLQRGLFKRICCSSVTQLIWAILSIIGLGFLAYFILAYYLI